MSERAVIEIGYCPVESQSMRHTVSLTMCGPVTQLDTIFIDSLAFLQPSVQLVVTLSRCVMMDQNELEHLALRGRWQDNGTYRGKNLCQTCLMQKATISSPEDQMTFEHVWHRWVYRLKRDRCAVCGELKETMMLPAQ